MSRQALGKGLSALLRDPSPSEAAAVAADVQNLPGLIELPLERVTPSSYQPRTHFDPTALDELARSLKAGGVLQPIIVRKKGEGYELVAGERRLRAAKIVGLERIPAIVRTLSNQQALEISLLENVQREDLNPIEQARGYDRLSSEFALTQEEIAERTGKDRTTIANLMRLLRLPDDVLGMVEEGKLTAGHARALLRLEDSPGLLLVLGRRMAARKVSVRQAEEMVERKLPGAKKQKVVQKSADPNVRAAEEALERALGTKVRIIERRGGRGRIEIYYYNMEDLDRIYNVVVAGVQ